MSAILSYLDNLLSLFKFDYRTDMIYQHLHCCFVSIDRYEIPYYEWMKKASVHKRAWHRHQQRMAKKIQLNQHTLFIGELNTSSESIKQFAICGIQWICNAWLVSGWLTAMWKWWKFGWKRHFATVNYRYFCLLRRRNDKKYEGKWAIILLFPQSSAYLVKWISNLWLLSV